MRSVSVGVSLRTRKSACALSYRSQQSFCEQTEGIVEQMGALLDAALHYAIEKHSGQKRKLHNCAFILHPLEVATIVSTMTDDEATLAACVLHDTIEDTDATFEDLKERFGSRVALLVMTETENKRPERPASETWHLRKEETLIMLQHTGDLSVKMMWLGDKLANMRSFYREYQTRGDDLWQDMHQKDPREQAWYYRTILTSLCELRHYDAYREYEHLVQLVFGNTEGGMSV